MTKFSSFAGKIKQATSDPVDPPIGYEYYNENTDKWRIYTATGWRELSFSNVTTTSTSTTTTTSTSTSTSTSTTTTTTSTSTTTTTTSTTTTTTSTSTTTTI